MDKTSVASCRRAEVTAPTASGASAKAQSSQSIPDILAQKTTAEAILGLRRQRDRSGNSASPAVASGTPQAALPYVFRRPRAKRKRSNESRAMVFGTEYKFTFGQYVVERDPVSRTPVTANCRFCFHFGREKRPTASVC
jgi:hypothetical protein